MDTNTTLSERPLPVFGASWSRTKYDQDFLAVDTAQSTRPLQYVLDPSFSEHCDRCLPTEVGWIGKQGVSFDTSRPMVDTESDLLNLNRLLSRDPRYRYRPQCITDQCVGVMNDCVQCQPKLIHFPVCGNDKYEFTRFTNPPCTLRGTGVNRFQPICLNPQDRSRWEHPGEIGINYRMVVKDNHVPCIPHPIDQTPALPRGGSIPCQPIYPTCSAPIDPLHNFYIRSSQIPINRYR